MQIQEATTSPGVGATVDLGALTSSIGILYNALAQTGGAPTEAADEVIGSIRRVGIDTLVQMAREGNQKVMQLLGLLYIVMQQAGEKGVGEAGELASTIARNLEEAGYTLQPHGCGCKQQSHGCGCKH